MKRILVIGAGASGMMAAISASINGNQVTIYEKSDRVGKKILATGNGKCNLTNLKMGTAFYYTENEKKLARCLEIFSEQDTLAFFESIGLMTRQKDGYVYIDNTDIANAHRDLYEPDGQHLTGAFYKYWGFNIMKAIHAHEKRKV